MSGSSNQDLLQTRLPPLNLCYLQLESFLLPPEVSQQTLPKDKASKGVLQREEAAPSHTLRADTPPPTVSLLAMP